MTPVWCVPILASKMDTHYFSVSSACISTRKGATGVVQPDGCCLSMYRCSGAPSSASRREVAPKPAHTAPSLLRGASQQVGATDLLSLLQSPAGMVAVAKFSRAKMRC